MNLKSIYLFISVAVFASCTSGKHGDTQANVIAVINDSVSQPVEAQDSFSTKKIIPRVYCKNDAANSYALYLPATYDGKKEFPVVFFFDSHGDGSYPLTQYSAIADELEFILVGSNNSKNGNDWSTTQTIWNSLSADVKQRIKISEKRMYTAGFSGGAKVACYVAMNYAGIKGVIANSAGFPEQQPTSSNPFDFVGLSGTGDMNMTDLVTLDKQLSQTSIKHQLIMFDGKHEWAPLHVMRNAFLFHQFNAMKDGLTGKDEHLIQSYLNDEKKSAEQLAKQKQYVKALQVSSNAYQNLNGLSANAAWMKTKADAISTDEGFQKQLKLQQDLLVREQNMKESFQQLMTNPDPAIWQKTVDDLNSKTKSRTEEAAMYQRILAYLSLACYSFSNRLIINNDNERAHQYVELYKIVDPTNAEAWYFSAIVNARFKQPQLIYSDLKHAIELGFKDVNRMQNQADFQQFGSQVNFEELVDMIK